MKRRLIAAVLSAVCLVFLSACKTSAHLVIHDDDTYNMSVDVTIPKSERPDYSCKRLREDLGQAGESSQLKITDSSLPAVTKCHMEFTVAQPIANTKAPFVEITRKGDVFRLNLAPIEDLTLLANQDTAFRLKVTFPGKVIGASGGDMAEINGNSVTWNSSEVLYRGFSAEGAAYNGPPIWQRGLIVLFLFIAVPLVLLIVFRKKATVRQIFAWIAQYDRKIGSPATRLYRLCSRAYYAVADRLWVMFHSR